MVLFEAHCTGDFWKGLHFLLPLKIRTPSKRPVDAALSSTVEYVKKQAQTAVTE